LPGTIALIGTRILNSGLQAVGRPLAASVAQLTGVAVTVAGLLLFLSRYGIIAAAVTSSVAYTLTFVLQLGILAGDPRFSMAEAFSVKGLIGDLATALGRRRPADALVP